MFRKFLIIVLPLLLNVSSSFIVSSGVQAAEILDLTWEDCTQEALKNNPDLVVAREKLKQAKLSYVITRSSYLPKVNSYIDASGVKAENTNRLDAYSYGVT